MSNLTGDPVVTIDTGAEIEIDTAPTGACALMHVAAKDSIRIPKIEV
jgi:hypothetical protein